MIRTNRSVKRKAALAGNKNLARPGAFSAGRKMNWFTVGASIFASNLGSEHFIGLSGSAAANGISVAAFELNALIILQLATWIFLPVLIVSKISTLPEYMQKRFGGKRIRSYLAILSILLYIFSKISVNLYSGGIFLQQAIGWNLYTSAMFVLALTSVMTLTGGVKGAMVIDNLQAFVMTTGASIVAMKALTAIGGWSGLRDRYPLAVASKVPSGLGHCAEPGSRAFQMLRPWDDKDMPWAGFLIGQTGASIWYWCADQMMVQRFLSARSLAHVQGSAVLAGYLKILPLLFMVIPGMISRCLYTDEVACIDPAECLKYCQSTVSCSNTAYPRLVLELMPSGARGMMVAAMVAALMNDLCNVFNSASALFSCDIWPLLRPRATQREQDNAGRVFVFVLVFASIMWIPVIQEMQGGQLFIYIQAVAAMFAPPISAVYCCAVLSKRTNETGAFWAMMIGFALGCLRLVMSFMYKEPSCGQELDERPWMLKYHYMYYAAFLFVVSISSAQLISRLTKPPAPFRLIRTTFWTRFDTSVRKDDKNVFEMRYSSSTSGKASIQTGGGGSTTNSTAHLVGPSGKRQDLSGDIISGGGGESGSGLLSLSGSPSPGLFTIREHRDELPAKTTPDLSSIIVDISSEAAKTRGGGGRGATGAVASSTSSDMPGARRTLTHQASLSNAGKLIASKLASEVNQKGAKAREMVLAAASHLKGGKLPISRIKFTNLEGDDDDDEEDNMNEQAKLRLTNDDIDDDDDDYEDYDYEDDEDEDEYAHSDVMTGEEDDSTSETNADDSGGGGPRAGRNRQRRSQSAISAAISSYKQKQLAGYHKASVYDDDEDDDDDDDDDEQDELANLNNKPRRAAKRQLGQLGPCEGDASEPDSAVSSTTTTTAKPAVASSLSGRQVKRRKLSRRNNNNRRPPTGAKLARARSKRLGAGQTTLGQQQQQLDAAASASDMDADLEQESGKFYKCLDNSVALLIKTRFEETILRVAVICVILVACCLFIGFSLPPDIRPARAPPLGVNASLPSAGPSPLVTVASNLLPPPTTQRHG